jgi:hypothetical protein
VSFEAADGVAVGLALGLLAGDVVARLGVAAGASDGHAVDGGVDLAVGAAIEAVTVGRPELAGIGAMPPARASLASVAKRSAPAISPTSLAAVSGPQPRSATS